MADLVVDRADIDGAEAFTHNLADSGRHRIEKICARAGQSGARLFAGM